VEETVFRTVGIRYRLNRIENGQVIEGIRRDPIQSFKMDTKK